MFACYAVDGVVKAFLCSWNDSSEIRSYGSAQLWGFLCVKIAIARTELQDNLTMLLHLTTQTYGLLRCKCMHTDSTALTITSLQSFHILDCFYLPVHLLSSWILTLLLALPTLFCFSLASSLQLHSFPRGSLFTLMKRCTYTVWNNTCSNAETQPLPRSRFGNPFV